MATAQSTPGGFNLYDLFTRVGPGAVAIFPMILYLYIIEEIPQIISSEMSVVMLTIGAFIVGEFIDLIRSTMFPVPLSFRRLLYNEINRDDILSRFDVWVLMTYDKLKYKFPDRLEKYITGFEIGHKSIYTPTDQEFHEMIKSQFEIDIDSHSIYDVYSVLLSYMEPKLSRRARRYQMLRVFSQNIFISAVIAVIYSLVIMYIFSSIPYIIYIILIYFVVSTSIGLAFVFSPAGHRFVDLLIIEFYTYNKIKTM